MKFSPTTIEKILNKIKKYCSMSNLDYKKVLNSKKLLIYEYNCNGVYSYRIYYNKLPIIYLITRQKKILVDICFAPVIKIDILQKLVNKRFQKEFKSFCDIISGFSLKQSEDLFLVLQLFLKLKYKKYHKNKSKFPNKFSMVRGLRKKIGKINKLKEEDYFINHYIKERPNVTVLKTAQINEILG